MKPTVLFLCSGNSCRSQMAEAFARKYAGDRMDVHSAGLTPQTIHPLTYKAMAEVGEDLEGHRPKGVDEYLGKLPVNYVFVVCDKAAGNCPTVWPGAANMQRIVRTFDDPAAATGSEEERLAVFRRVRDEIDKDIKQWVEKTLAGNSDEKGSQ
jgi:arsenate reductase